MLLYSVRVCVGACLLCKKMSALIDGCAEACCGMGRESMLQKSRERSRTKKYLHRNLTAGHVTPSEHYLERAGLRGRKRWLLGCLLLLLLLVALGNLALTCLILSVLQFGTTGFSYFTFSGISTLWHLGGNLTNVTIAAPHGISSFNDGPLTLSSTTGATGQEQIRAEVLNRQTSLTLRSNAVNLSVGDSFGVVGRGGHCLVFANGSVSQVDTLSVSGDVRTPQLTTPIVTGASGVHSAGHLLLQGEAGVSIRGGVVNITAGGRVSLSGQNIVIDGERGVALGLQTTPTTRYHLCTTRNGTLFLVPSNPRRCLGPT